MASPPPTDSPGRGTTVLLFVVLLGALALAGFALYIVQRSGEVFMKTVLLETRLEEVRTELQTLRLETEALRRAYEASAPPTAQEVAASPSPVVPATDAGPEATSDISVSAPPVLHRPLPPAGDVLPPRRPVDPVPAPLPPKPSPSGADPTATAGSLVFRVDSMRWATPGRKDKSDCLIVRCAITNQGTETARIPMMTLMELRDGGKNQSHTPTEHCPTGEYPGGDEVNPGKTVFRSAGFFVPKASRYRLCFGDATLDITP